MPQIRRVINRAQPTTQPGAAQVNPNIFAGEAEAQRQLGGAIRQAGQTSFDIGNNILELQAQEDLADAQLAANDHITSSRDALTSDPDLSSLNRRTADSFDAFANNYLAGIKNPKSKRRIRAMFQFQKQQAIVKANGEAAKRILNRKVANIPNRVDALIEAEISARTPAEKEQVQLQKAAYFDELITTGARSGDQVAGIKESMDTELEQRKKARNIESFQEALMAVGDDAQQLVSDKEVRKLYGLTLQEAQAEFKRVQGWQKDMEETRKKNEELAKEKARVETTDDWMNREAYTQDDILQVEIDHANGKVSTEHRDAIIKIIKEDILESGVDANTDVDEAIARVGDGAMDVAQAQEILRNNRGNLTTAEYKEYRQSLSREFNRSQDGAMSRAHDFAKTQIISIPESMLEQLISAINQEQDEAQKKDLELQLKSRKEQYKEEHRELHQFNIAMRDWRKQNPDATPEQIDAEAIRKLNIDFSPQEQAKKQETVTIRRKSDGQTFTAPKSAWEQSQKKDQYEVVK